MFMTRGDGTDLLGITAAHVVCPSRLFPENKGFSEQSAESHHENIIALGSGAYEDAVKRIERSATSSRASIRRSRGSRGCGVDWNAAW